MERILEKTPDAQPFADKAMPRSAAALAFRTRHCQVISGANVGKRFGIRVFYLSCPLKRAQRRTTQSRLRVHSLKIIHWGAPPWAHKTNRRTTSSALFVKR